jgi:hypothetical protein
MTVSVIVYGRNDGHGYNMHKRVAISLNCIAEKLDHEDDEIIFVDWNSPEHLPTLIEDIFDTLTSKAQGRIRTFRVRSSIHDELSPADSKRPTIEPFARNVGIRRSNPKNNWILNTNTDMVFLSQVGSLSRLISQLPKGFYNAYRYEIPEYLWNSTSRMHSAEFMDKLQNWSTSARLTRKVFLQREDHKVPDGPGDFQLAPRETFFELKGFPESMRYGWHVDSAMSQLLVGKLGFPIILEENQLEGFHCNHLRHLTHFHTSNEKQNEYEYGDEVVLSDDNWGLFDREIEEIYVPNLNLNIEETLKKLGPSLSVQPESSVNVVTDIFYPTDLTLTFLIDLLVTKQANSHVKYLGFNQRVKDQLSEIVQRFSLKFDASEIDNDLSYNSIKLDNTSLIIIDLGIDEASAHGTQIKDLSLPIRAGMAKLAENLPSLAHILRSKSPHTEIAVIGPLSWGLRLILSNDFQTPLFNNYSQILAGRVREVPQSQNSNLGNKLTQAEIRNHFGLPTTRDLVSSVFRFTLRFAPRWLKRVLKPIVYFLFRSIQKLR